MDKIWTKFSDWQAYQFWWSIGHTLNREGISKENYEIEYQKWLKNISNEQNQEQK